MSFKTINNTTPFFEGTDTHALVGHSSYSTTGTTSFSAIHTDVAGQEYIPFGAPATTNGPRRISRDEFLENENNGNAVGKDEEVPEMLTVYAFAKGNHARTILVVDNQANDYYVQGEDMLFISSGVEGNSTSVVETPVNMYTAAEKTPMMVDVRQGISQIPLGFLMAKNKKADTFELAFYLSPNWTRTCYLFDKVMGQRRRIMNGSIFTLPMPANHEERYIIEGPDEYIGEEDKPSISTDFDTQTAPDTKAYKVLHNQQIYILHNGHTYTLTGLEVKW